MLGVLEGAMARTGLYGLQGGLEPGWVLRQRETGTPGEVQALAFFPASSSAGQVGRPLYQVSCDQEVFVVFLSKWN